MALALIVYGASSYGQTPADSCWLCLTEAEARQAVDSALWGQHNVRQAAIMTALYRSQAMEVRSLRDAIMGKDAGLALRDRETEALRRSLDLMADDARRAKWRATRRTIGWAALLGGMGFVAGVIVVD